MVTMKTAQKILLIAALGLMFIGLTLLTSACGPL